MFGLTKKLSIVALYICLFIGSGIEAIASSEFLLKSTADTKLGNLTKCIKSNDNDVSICMDKFQEYLKAEIALMRSAEDKTKYSQRLSKMLDYLSQSADIFYEKAQTTRDIIYYEKASRCATLLVKLSEKYKSYEKMVNDFENVKQGATSTVLLEILYKKTRKEQYPSVAFQEAFNSLVNKSLTMFAYLDSGLQKDIRAFSNGLILKYMAHMRSIVTALESYTVPDFGAIADEFIVYKAAIKIPGVDTHQEESLSLRKKAGIMFGTCLGKVKEVKAKASKHFLDGDTKFSKATDELETLKSIICLSSEYINSPENLFLDVPLVPNDFLDALRDSTDFLQISIQASNEASANEYVKAVKLWDKALSLHSVEKRLRERAQQLQSNAIQAALDQALNVAQELANQKRFPNALEKLEHLKASVALDVNQEKSISDLKQRIEREAEIDRIKKIQIAVDQTLTLAQELANQEKFPEALKELENLRTSVTLNTMQEQNILSLRDKIQTQGQHYVLKSAKSLKSKGNHMAALRTIDMTKITGMNDELTEFYNVLRNNFDWRQLETIEDTRYFVNCSFPDLAGFMKFPNKASSNTYCEFNIYFENQIDKDGYVGSLGGDVSAPVYVSIINPVFKGSTLINKQAFCVFRINGTKGLLNPLTDSTVNVPYLEAIYIQ